MVVVASCCDTIPTKQGLEQHLDLLESYCQNWTLTLNLAKTKIVIVQNEARSHENRPLRNTTIEHLLHSDWLGLWKFWSGIEYTKRKSMKSSYAINKNFHHVDIPNKLGAKSCNVYWQCHYSYCSKWVWEVHSVCMTILVPACRILNILTVQRKTPANSCRASKLGRFPLVIPVRKRTQKFGSTLPYEALKTQKLSPKNQSSLLTSPRTH